MAFLIRKRLRLSHHRIDAIIHKMYLITAAVNVSVIFLCLFFHQFFHFFQHGNHYRVAYSRDYERSVCHTDSSLQLHLIAGGFLDTAALYHNAAFIVLFKTACFQIHDHPRPMQYIGMFFFIKSMGGNG